MELDSSQLVREKTRAWVQRVVIGLNLCPFAKAVEVKGQIRYVVSEAESPDGLREALAEELRGLANAEPELVDTILLIHPFVLGEFLAYNEFLDEAEALVAELGLVGQIQIASFHPHYQFAGTAPEDIENHTNRSPYPMLHLLREASISRGLASFAEPSRIFEDNIERLRALGHEGLRRVADGEDG